MTKCVDWSSNWSENRRPLAVFQCHAHFLRNLVGVSHKLYHIMVAFCRSFQMQPWFQLYHHYWLRYCVLIIEDFVKIDIFSWKFLRMTHHDHLLDHKCFIEGVLCLYWPKAMGLGIPKLFLFPRYSNSTPRSRVIFFENPVKKIFWENDNFDQNLVLQNILWSIQLFQCFQGGSLYHIYSWVGLSCLKTYWSWFMDSSWSCHVFFQNGFFQTTFL